MEKSLEKEKQSDKKGKDRKSVSMRIKPSIHRSIKRLALENDCLISDIVEEALKEYLSKHSKV